jgi:hypothetical protein
LQTKGGLRIISNRPLPPLEIPHDNVPVERLELDLELPPSMGLYLNACTVAGCSEAALGLGALLELPLVMANTEYEFQQT